VREIMRTCLNLQNKPNFNGKNTAILSNSPISNYKYGMHNIVSPAFKNNMSSGIAVSFSGKPAFIFDMDGVIIHSVPIHEEEWRKYFQKNGKDLSSEEMKEKLSGKTTRDAIKYLFEGKELSDKEIEKHGEKKERAYRKALIPKLKPLDGFWDFVNILKSKNIPIAIASSAPPENVSQVVGKLGLREYFKTIIHGKKVKNGKPNPEIFNKAFEDMNKKADEPILKEDCIVIEDSLSGVKAGVNAHMPVIGVTTSHSEQELLDAGADYVIKDFNDERLKSLVNEKIHSLDKSA
jgi:HAD superfamily hydrolase (TIGR01509 family)